MTPEPCFFIHLWRPVRHGAHRSLGDVERAKKLNVQNTERETEDRLYQGSSISIARNSAARIVVPSSCRVSSLSFSDKGHTGL